MSGLRLLTLIFILAATASLTTCQRWPNFRELFHRLKMYQSNPRVFRGQSVPLLPSPAAQVSRKEITLNRRNDSATGSFSAQMSYNQKKAALKKLLIKSAGTKQSNVAPLALGLLQKLKGRPVQVEKHFYKQASRKNKIMSHPLQTDKQTSLLASKFMSKPLQADHNSNKPASLPTNKISQQYLT